MEVGEVVEGSVDATGSDSLGAAAEALEVGGDFGRSGDMSDSGGAAVETLAEVGGDCGRSGSRIWW